MADFLFAAWFLWITPAEAALSSLRLAAAARALASSVLPASAASRNLRTADFSADFTDLLRSCAFLFCRLRLIWDLMFATGQASGSRSMRVGSHGASRQRARPLTLATAAGPPKIGGPAPAPGATVRARGGRWGMMNRDGDHHEILCRPARGTAARPHRPRGPAQLLHHR